MQNVNVEYINPEGLPKNPGFSQAVVTSGAVKTIYIGMQNAVDSTGIVVGRGDVAAQTEQALKNLQACLEATVASPENLVMWNIYLCAGQPIQPAFAAFQKWWGTRVNPPANTVLFVSGMPVPEFLVGIDAVAVVSVG